MRARYVHVTAGDRYRRRGNQHVLASVLASGISIASSVLALFIPHAWGPFITVAGLGLALGAVHLKTLRRMGW